MELTVASWNLDGWHTISDAQLDLLDEHGIELLLAQEVTPASLDRLRDVGWIGASALELLPTDHRERDGVRPRFACAVLTRGRVRFARQRWSRMVPSPARALAADVTVGEVTDHAVSAALPPGSMWERAAKQGQAEALTGHQARQSGPVVLGMDRNGPKFERWAAAETAGWSEDAPWFFTTDAQHGLTDVLDAFHADPGHADAARRARPDGPREVSYVERCTRPPIARRYDVILASDHWRVLDVAYDYDGALLEAGSDHALETCRLGPN